MISGLLRVNGDVGQIDSVVITPGVILLTADIRVTKDLVEPVPCFLLTDHGDVVLESTDLVQTPARRGDVMRMTHRLGFDHVHVGDGVLPPVRS